MQNQDTLIQPDLGVQSYSFLREATTRQEDKSDLPAALEFKEATLPFDMAETNLTQSQNHQPGKQDKAVQEKYKAGKFLIQSHKHLL
jgi:hypothetical protein